MRMITYQYLPWSANNLRVSIIFLTEELCLNEFARKQSNWEEDFDNLIPLLLDENQPAYLLFRYTWNSVILVSFLIFSVAIFRLDSQNSLGYEWLFITWIPEHAPVREKMIYASTKATLKSQFGSGQIKEDILGTVAVSNFIFVTLSYNHININIVINFWLEGGSHTQGLPQTKKKCSRSSPFNSSWTRLGRC